MAQSNQGSRRWTSKQLMWGCVLSLGVGAIVTYQTGFNWVGQWETGQEVEQKLAVATCVEDFLLKSDRGVIHAALKDIDSSYKRRQMLQEQKLASGSSVADACGDQIRAFEAIMFPAA